MPEEITQPIVQEIPKKSAIITPNTSVNTTNENFDEGIFGLSVRGILTSIIVITVCGLVAFKIPIEETLKAGFFMTLGFYFSSKK